MSLFEVLPAELISQVLFELDPASFYICLQTSRLFRAHALASTKLIHDQLYRIPGERVFYDNVIGDANYLLRLFSKRATQHLFNGAEQMADIHVWQASPSMDRKTSCLTTSRESEHAQAVMGKSLPPAVCNFGCNFVVKQGIMGAYRGTLSAETPLYELCRRRYDTLAPGGLIPLRTSFADLVP